MRPTRPERRAARGITLIELVLTMLLVGIIVGATVYFFYPVAQSVDVAGRAVLTDTADNALQRIGPVSTLVEWDGNLPDFPRLCEEAAHARAILETVQDRDARPRQHAAADLALAHRA